MPQEAITRAKNEISHGRNLAMSSPEDIWGWGSPAGRVRAERRAKMIAEMSGLQPGKRALEVGCGSGFFTEKFAQYGVSLTAVDISDDLLKLARIRGLPKDQVRFVCNPFEECDVEGPYDAIIGSSILHHLDIKVALTKMHSMLKLGGRLGFAEPNMLNPQIALQKNIPWLKKLMGDSPDETAFFRWKLLRLLNDVSFREVRIIPFDWLHPSTPDALIPIISRIGHHMEKIPVLREFSGSLLISAVRA